MKDHYQPLTAGQIHHVLTQYQLGTRERPSVWSPSEEEMKDIEQEGNLLLMLEGRQATYKQILLLIEDLTLGIYCA